ncbi:MAG: helix-turn-helix transcriptional regulator [Candidatus Poribacteria bacterium]|nr:helix-turn-helix transcriptional regulator [Candidatus Poribacteria bacterium]
MDDLVVFGNNVRRIRKAQRLTQAELGSRADLYPRNVGGVERGERNVTLRTMTKIAAALGVPLSELVAGIPTKR